MGRYEEKARADAEVYELRRTVDDLRLSTLDLHVEPLRRSDLDLDLDLGPEFGLGLELPSSPEAGVAGEEANPQSSSSRGRGGDEYRRRRESVGTSDDLLRLV